MTNRDAQALLIVIVCAMILAFSFRFLISPQLRGTFYYWARAFQVVVVAYIGALYLLSFLHLTGTVFGGSLTTMAYFRPAILLLLVSVLIDTVWRYRARI